MFFCLNSCNLNVFLGDLCCSFGGFCSFCCNCCSVFLNNFCDLNFLVHFFLKFGHITFVLPAVVICMIFFERDMFAKAACFLLWVMVFNTLLKYLFKVPLFPHLGVGYAFPSGHMHASAAFYGYLLYRSDKKYIKFILGILICCLGFSLIYCRFHDLKDVVGALLFAALEITAYHFLHKHFGERTVGVIAFSSSIAIMMLLSVIHKVEFHVWLAFYGLAGMELALGFTEDPKLHSVSQKFMALFMAFSLMILVYYFFKIMAFDKFCISEIRFAFIPLMVVGSKQIVARK